MQTSGTPEGFTCATAPGKVFATRADMLAHYKSDWHRYNLKRKVANLPPIPEKTFLLMQSKADARRMAAESVKKQDHVKKGKRHEVEKRRMKKTSKEEAERTRDVQEPSEFQIDEEEAQKPVNSCASMFELREPHVSDTIELNLEYMQKNYGFFVPDVEFVDDLQGLITYCTKKIRVGHLCLFCDKGCPTVQATIQHMIDKSHCKIRWGTPEDLEEFEEFYDFSKTWSSDAVQNSEDTDVQMAQPVSKSTLEYLDSGEIRFHDADGTSRTVGTRGFRRYYKQKYAKEDTRASVLADSKEKLLLMYKRAGVETSTELSTWRRNQKHVYTKEERKMVRRQKVSQMYAAREKLRDGLQVNMLTKNRVAKKNVGQGLGVHG
mmetsp:Transcript_12583/g.14432  ORF Transcript_12583/g.14432 Transcript_12583/m.14432 type:complete len:377 (-) Transcript_12583:26-1156(-)